MSDLMLLGILRMPDASISGDCAGFMQFVSAARGAADRIESDAKIIEQLRAELEAAAADKRDAERYRWLRDEDAGVPDGERELCVVQFRLPFTEAPDRDLFDVALDAAIDAALAQRQGEGS
ncbi:hypothetical protein WK91_18580 [Burkholderia cepacia]|uniref:hypothetical protein n=1 Tax=Burkholderia cepacia TaxID=292 RepID=UPI00075CE02E|nr:hypothetical protein [Burkholderia cepacia]KVW15442.1 hypothetical protein WK91_18580 [Burkholderia cepacia]